MLGSRDYGGVTSDAPNSTPGLLAALSQEMRQTLAGVIAGTEMLLANEAGPVPPAQQRLLSGVERGAHRLASIADDLLVLAEEDAAPGWRPADRSVVPVEQVVGSAIARLECYHRDGSARIRLADPTPRAYLLGRAERFSQAVANVLDNAVKYTPADGEIEILTGVDESGVRVRVTDTGVGIPADELDRVFEAFFRSSRTRIDDRPGLGIGLTAARVIARSYGGGIEVAPALGGGTSVLITLPGSS